MQLLICRITKTRRLFHSTYNISLKVQNGLLVADKPKAEKPPTTTFEAHSASGGRACYTPRGESTKYLDRPP